MVIDAHQHFWKYNPIRDAWIDDSMEVIRKDFLPSDLAPILKSNGVDGCIAIQADQSEKETQFLLNCSKEVPFIKGVVGWVDLQADNCNERLAYFSKNPLLKGIRHIVQAEKEGFMLETAFQRGIGLLRKYNLVYDILVFPNQLKEVIQLVKKFPEQTFVLDHIAKPYIKDSKIEDWKRDIKTLAKLPNINCKVSGMVTEADVNNWEITDFTPYLDVVFNQFGTDRILYGSDWPVCLLAGNYKEQFNIVKLYSQKFSEEEKTKVLGKNAVKIYNL